MFNNIVFLYESCLKDKTLINTYFDTINNLKLNILNNIEFYRRFGQETIEDVNERLLRLELSKPKQ